MKFKYSINCEDTKTKGEQMKMNKYQQGKERAREEAKEWQALTININPSWGELAEAYEKFLKLGKRYGLLKEFKENCIL